MKIALLCSGAGRVQRGFERLAFDMHRLVSDDVDMTLFKGGGPVAPGERRIFNTPRDGWLTRLFPVHKLFGRPPYWSEGWSFGLAAFPHLVREKYDLVQYFDLPVGQVLGRLRRLFGARFRLLFTQGSSLLEPRHYPEYDHVHHIGSILHEEALAAGISPERASLVPCGVDADRLREGAPRAETRRRLGIPQDAFVVLSVAALNRHHKRVHHVIEEMSHVPGSALLWLDGHPEDPSLPILARERLDDRCRISRVPSETVPDLYRMADLFVLASLDESFGLVIVEAMCAGLPVLVHDDPHMRWLVGNDSSLVDMTARGALAATIERLRADPGERRRISEVNIESATRRFHWGNLKAEYLGLYRRALGH